jgi:hypothetical protein
MTRKTRNCSPTRLPKKQNENQVTAVAECTYNLLSKNADACLQRLLGDFRGATDF